LLHNLDIQSLRGIRDGSFAELTPLVVLVGPNSSGKSTVLDAILIGASPSPDDGLRVAMERRKSGVNPHHWLTWRSKDDSRGMAELRLKSDTPHWRVVQILRTGQGGADAPFRTSSFYESPEHEQEKAARLRSVSQRRSPPPPDSLIEQSNPFNDIPYVRLVDSSSTEKQTPLDQLYTQLSERGLRNDAKALIKALLPQVEDIEVLTPGGTPVIYLAHADGSRPVDVAGDGIRLLVRQCFELAAPEHGIVLLEEPEVHLHPRAMRQLARATWAAVRRKIQVFVTTHSLDLIDALLAAAEESELEQLAVFRLQLSVGQLSTTRLSGTEAASARTQIEEDLR